MKHRLIVVSAFACALLHEGSAAAQTAGDGGPDPSKVRVRIGPLSMNPTVSLTNLGIDQNVFNESDELNPKSDFTFTVTPNTDLWLRAGRTWITGALKEELVWYRTYATERAANTTYAIGWRVPLNRVNLRANATHRNVHDRPGFEIDARSRRTETAYDGLAEYRGLSKTFFGVTATRQQVDFNEDAVFLGTNLHVELNRIATSYGASLRHQLTPLTSIRIEAKRSQDRFELSPLRDSNATAVTTTISFDPLALVTGTATFGYTDFEPLSPGLENFKGVTAAVNLSYTLMGSTRFAVAVSREVLYSFDVNQPYYVQTGLNGSVTQQIFGPLDVVVRAGVQNLEYRDRAGAAVQVPNRLDQIRTYGGGVGYRLGQSLRLGVNADDVRRVSDVQRRTYNNTTFGTSLTYVF